MKPAVITITTVAPLSSMGQAADEGKATYDKVCTVCHSKGIVGAPKLGGK
jgi:cytochrome c5